ncbi:uncharacterized protein LOC135337936 isoform X4 [Halichondria panicea]|uniref:uncharacterized protein LOC135337936 isoform X4 n=1 Tax=Halichondria panicea TaxID=6063 RepID=UPI00312B5711
MVDLYKEDLGSISRFKPICGKNNYQLAELERDVLRIDNLNKATDEYSEYGGQSIIALESPSLGTHAVIDKETVFLEKLKTQTIHQVTETVLGMLKTKTKTDVLNGLLELLKAQTETEDFLDNDIIETDEIVFLEKLIAQTEGMPQGAPNQIKDMLKFKVLNAMNLRISNIINFKLMSKVKLKLKKIEEPLDNQQEDMNTDVQHSEHFAVSYRVLTNCYTKLRNELQHAIPNTDDDSKVGPTHQSISVSSKKSENGEKLVKNAQPSEGINHKHTRLIAELTHEEPSPRFTHAQSEYINHKYTRVISILRSENDTPISSTKSYNAATVRGSKNSSKSNNGNKDSTPGKRDNESSSQRGSNSSGQNTSSSSSNGNCGGASGCGGSGGKDDDDEGHEDNHRRITKEISAEEEFNEEASKDVEKKQNSSDDSATSEDKDEPSHNCVDSPIDSSSKKADSDPTAGLDMYSPLTEPMDPPVWFDMYSPLMEPMDPPALFDMYSPLTEPMDPPVWFDMYSPLTEPMDPPVWFDMYSPLTEPVNCTTATDCLNKQRDSDTSTNEPSFQLHTELLNDSMLNKKQHQPTKQQTIKTELRIELSYDETEEHVEEKRTQLHPDQPSLLLLNRKPQTLSTQQTEETEPIIELTNHCSVERGGQVNEKHVHLHANQQHVQLHSEQSDDQEHILLDGKSQLQLAKEKNPKNKLADDPPSEIEVREKDAQLHDNQPSSQLPIELPDGPLLNGKQQLPTKQQTIETEPRIEHELTGYSPSESEGQVEEKLDAIADPPTVQLHTEQCDDQAPTLLDEKSQLQEKKPTIELVDNHPSQKPVGVGHVREETRLHYATQTTSLPRTESKVLPESEDAIRKTKLFPITRVNRQPDNALKPKHIAQSREAHGSSKAIEPTFKKAQPPTKLAAKQGNNRTVRKSQQSVEQTQYKQTPNPTIVKCKNNNGSKDTTTGGKSDNGSSSQTGSNSSSKNTSSSSSSSSSNGDGASASGCGGSGGRDDDERNKDNHSSYEDNSTDEASSDNEETSEKQSHDITTPQKRKVGNKLQQQKQAVTVEEAKTSSKGNNALIPATKPRSRQPKKRKKTGTVRGGDVALDYNNSDTSTRSIAEHKQPSDDKNIIKTDDSGADDYESDTSEVKLKPFHLPVSPSASSSSLEIEPKLDNSFHSLLNGAALSSSPGSLVSPHQVRPPEPAPVEAPRIDKAPANASQLVRPPEYFSLTGRKSKTVLQHANQQDTLDEARQECRALMVPATTSQLVRPPEDLNVRKDNKKKKKTKTKNESLVASGASLAPVCISRQTNCGIFAGSNHTQLCSGRPLETNTARLECSAPGQISDPPHLLTRFHHPRPPEENVSQGQKNKSKDEPLPDCHKVRPPEPTDVEAEQFAAPTQVTGSHSSSELVVYSHWRRRRCHEMNTAHPFHYIRPPSNHYNGPTLFMALSGSDAGNELAPSPGAVVLASDPSTGQSGPLMEATNCRPRQCFFNVHGRRGNGVLLRQEICDFVTLDDGAKELCQVIVDIIQFLRQKQHGLTTLESITIDVPRAISIPESHLVPLNSHQTAITLGLLVRLVEEFLDLWERRYPGSGSAAISSLQLFVSWFRGVESSGQGVETALLGEALLKLRTH